MSSTVPVPETVLKNKRSRKERRQERLAKKLAEKKANRAKKSEYFNRAQKYSAQYRKAERELIRLRREARRNGNFFVEPEAKLIWAVRIKGLSGVAPKVRKALQLLRLRQINNAVFVKVNKASLNMLRMVEPYIAYGYPSVGSVKKLIYKRGYAKVNGQRIPITDNKIIENALGKYNIICMEDLIHEIVTVGPHFREANNFLWPFKMRSPKGGFNRIKKHFIEGGDYGNRENEINKLIIRML
eukprot:GEZU01032517.1.p2 GENE.GEZU01032517.1~~GEZU01032517.1.p2  ORF type:complete len:263 (+),score=100.30 GEZU01032517.1:66-791(+)